MEPAWARRLVDIYGARARAILERARREPALASVVDEAHGVTAAEVVQAMDTEFARTLADVLMRRTMVGLEPDVDVPAVEAVAEVMARHAGWPAERTTREIDDYLAQAQRARPNARLMREAGSATSAGVAASRPGSRVAAGGQPG